MRRTLEKNQKKKSAPLSGEQNVVKPSPNCISTAYENGRFFSNEFSFRDVVMMATVTHFNGAGFHAIGASNPQNPASQSSCGATCGILSDALRQEE